jgi:hypothetical protein
VSRRYKVPDTTLSFSVNEESQFFVVDFFDEKGMFIESRAIPKAPTVNRMGVITYSRFVGYFDIEKKGPWHR